MPLAEVPENRAKGRIADIYADIRAVSGLPSVNLVFRHLAAGDASTLATVWAVVRPSFADGTLAHAGSRLLGRLPQVRGPYLDSGLCQRAGLETSGQRALAATMRAFVAANAMNLIMVTRIGPAPLPPVVSSGLPSVAPPLEVPDWHELLPLPASDQVPAVSAALIAECTRMLVPGVEPEFQPTLLRYLAPYPLLLDGLSRSVDAHRTVLKARSQLLSDRAVLLAQELGVLANTDVETTVSTSLERVHRTFGPPLVGMLALASTLRLANSPPEVHAHEHT